MELRKRWALSASVIQDKVKHRQLRCIHFFIPPVLCIHTYKLHHTCKRSCKTYFFQEHHTFAPYHMCCLKTMMNYSLYNCKKTESLYIWPHCVKTWCMLSHSNHSSRLSRNLPWDDFYSQQNRWKVDVTSKHLLFHSSIFKVTFKVSHQKTVHNIL